MPYCRICEVRKVQNEGDVCPNCQDTMLPQSIPTFSVSEAGNRSPSDDYTNRPSAETNRENNGDDTATDDDSTYRVKSKRYRGGTSDSAQPKQYGGSSHRYNPSGQNSTQPVNPIPAGPSVATPVAAAANAAATTSNSGAITEGVVRNIQKKQDSRFGIGKWMYCFFSGISFTTSSDMMEFQVFNNWNSSSSSSGPSADKVIVYGTIQNGEPVNDNTVKIYGKRVQNNFIVAEQIENTTDGTYATFSPAHISATAVRIITLSIILIIAALILMVVLGVGSGVGSAGTAWFSGFADSLPAFFTKAIFVVIGGAVTLSSIKRAWQSLMNGNWSGVGYSLLIALIAAAVVFSLFR